MVYDAADNYVILFSGNGGNAPLGDTWKFLAGSWTNITPSNSPSPRYDASIAFDVADSYVILFRGISSYPYGYVCDTWKFLAGSWTNITPNNSPSPRYDSSIAFDVADGYVILFSGNGGYVPSGDVWKFSSLGTPPVFDYSLSNNGPVSITQGMSGSLAVTATLASGTAQPVALSCSSLPTGITCDSFNVNPVTPTGSSGLTVSVPSSVSPGAYSFMVNGSPAGATASASTTTVSLTVTPVSSKTTTTLNISCSASSIKVGTFTTCAVTATGAYPSGDVTLSSSSPTGVFIPSTGICALSTAGSCSTTYT